MSSPQYQNAVRGGSRPVQKHRSQPLPRLSTHSSTTSNASKRNSARISKLDTPNSSPHNVQRRRTTASHPSRVQPRPAFDNAHQARDQRLRQYYGSRYSMPVMRPMSWQPGNDSIQTTNSQPLWSDPAIGTTIAGLENLAVTNTPSTSVQQSIEDAFSMAYGFPISASSLEGQQPQHVWDNTQVSDPMFPDGGSQYCMDYTAYSASHDNFFDQSNGGQSFYDQPIFDAPHQHQASADVYASLKNFPGEYNEMFGQPQPAYPAYAHAMPKSTMRKKRSKELFGIGLYEDKQPGYLSSLNADTNRQSLGKELKLEETWSPPNKAADADDEEECSSEEGEEVEDIPPYMGSVTMDSQSTLCNNFSDLSNQSFFFADDDQFATEDQYASYFALGQSLQTEQAKVTAASTGHVNLMLL